MLEKDSKKDNTGSNFTKTEANTKDLSTITCEKDMVLFTTKMEGTTKVNGSKT